jgi:hypothetical protein
MNGLFRGKILPAKDTCLDTRQLFYPNINLETVLHGSF